MVALMLNERLFAKKGEAVPAGIPVRDPAAKRGDGGASALSFLIQRGAVDGSTAAAKPVEAPLPAPMPAAPPAWPDDDAPAYVTAPRVQAAGGGLPPQDDPDDDPEWRRVSFRLSADSHRRLRNIARLWGVSGQSLLQKAVANFLDAAVTGDDPNWRH